LGRVRINLVSLPRARRSRVDAVDGNRRRYAPRALMVPVISGCDAGTFLKKALRTYLESAFCRIWTAYAVETGRPVSLAEVNERIPDEAECKTALELVNALLGS
jgi:hypothetical protein